MSPSFAFGIAGDDGARAYLLFGRELVLEWAPVFGGADAVFHYRADVYGEGPARSCYLSEHEACWLRWGPLQGECLAAFESADVPPIEAVMRADYGPAAEQVRAVLAGVR